MILRSFLSSVAAVIAVSAFGANLLSNPGFENGDLEWGNYDKKVWRPAPGEGENGSAAMLYELKEGKVSGFPRQRVKLVPGKNYRYSVRVRHENLHLDDKRDNGVQVSLFGLDAAGKQTCGRFLQGMRGTSDGWYEIWELLFDVPSNTVSGAFQISVWQGVKGKAWFDNAKVEEYIPPMVESLHSSAYRDCAWNGYVVFAAALTVPDDKLCGAAGEFSYLDENGEKQVVKAATLDASTAKATLKVDKLYKGRQTISFRLLDKSGMELGRSELPFTRVETRPGEWRVWFDENQVMRIGDERFFPVGVYCNGKKVDEWLKLFTDIPFNTFHCYGVPTKAGLDLCFSSGVRVIPGINGAYAGSRGGMRRGIRTLEEQHKYVKSNVDPVKDHPAVIAWYLNDEPRPVLTEKLEEQQSFFKKLDPSRPTCSTFDHPEYVRGFMKGFDILDSDPYPIGRWPIRTVLDWCEFYRSGALSVKPLWLTPQCFSWKWFRMGRSMPDAHMPSREELGSMVWQGVVAGANGINFYGPAHFFKKENESTSKENLAVLRHVVKELRSVSDTIVSPEKPVTVKDLPKQLRARAWRCKGSSYVLVVNPDEMPVKGTFRLSESFGNSEIVVGKGLKLLKGNAVDVNFPPIGYSVIRLYNADPK